MTHVAVQLLEVVFRYDFVSNCITLRERKMGGDSMDRGTLLFRVSLIWLAIVSAGCVYVLL
jgi:hypothetical protein